MKEKLYLAYLLWEAKAETWKQKLKQVPWRNVAYWLALPAHNGLGPHYINHNQENAPQAYRLT